MPEEIFVLQISIAAMANRMPLFFLCLFAPVQPNLSCRSIKQESPVPVLALGFYNPVHLLPELISHQAQALQMSSYIFQILRKGTINVRCTLFDVGCTMSDVGCTISENRTVIINY